MERACSEQALRESEAKYRTLFESINDGFAIVEMLYNDDTPFDFRFLEVSPSFEAQSGLAQVPYVFDTFRQSECSQGGLGLGLAIARHLVELHGGTINAECLGVGQGATFTVKLPLIGVNL